jgi:beta-phosphoglucomutase-like phosphatase (HAD superfamily)
MSSAKRIEAVLFDVDGVAVESELLHLQTFNEILEPYGIRISAREWKTRFLGAGSAVIMTTLFEENEISEDPTPLISERRLLYKQHVENGELHPVRGFLSFFESIQLAKLPVAFVSTGHPVSLGAALKHLGLLGKYPVIDVTQVTRTKPDPEAYLLGAKILKINAKYCLVFEDSPIGVTAAKSAHMTCVALTTTNPATDLSHADLIIPNFKGLSIHSICEQLGIPLKG